LAYPVLPSPPIVWGRYNWQLVRPGRHRTTVSTGVNVRYTVLIQVDMRDGLSATGNAQPAIIACVSYCCATYQYLHQDYNKSYTFASRAAPASATSVEFQRLMDIRESHEFVVILVVVVCHCVLLYFCVFV